MPRKKTATKAVAKRKKPGTPGKPRGTLSKKARSMMEMLEKKRFNPVEEFLGMYLEERALYTELLETMKDEDKRPEMSKSDERLFKFLAGELRLSLETLFKYVFPTLRSIESKGDVGTRPILNFNLNPQVEMKQVEPSEPVIDISTNETRNVGLIGLLNEKTSD